MSDQRDETIDVLESLLAHPGWQLLTAEALKEWHQRELDGQEKALAADDPLALSLLRQIVASRKAVTWVLAWPKQELAKRKRHSGSPSDLDLPQLMSRRGSL